MDLQFGSNACIFYIIMLNSKYRILLQDYFASFFWLFELIKWFVPFDAPQCGYNFIL